MQHNAVIASRMFGIKLTRVIQAIDKLLGIPIENVKMLGRISQTLFARCKHGGRICNSTSSNTCQRVHTEGPILRKQYVMCGREPGILPKSKKSVFAGDFSLHNYFKHLGQHRHFSHCCSLQTGILFHLNAASGVHHRSYCENNQLTKTKVKSVKGTAKKPDLIPPVMSTKKVAKKKKVLGPKDEEKFKVTAYPTGGEMDLDSLTEYIQEQGLYKVVPLPEDCSDCIHVEAAYKIDEKLREIFFFRDGQIVFWNIPRTERNVMIEATNDHQKERNPHEMIEQEQESVLCKFIETESCMNGDEINLQRPPTSADRTAHQLEKFTFSNVLADSVNLGVAETTLQEIVDNTKHLVQDLRMGGKIKVSKEDVLKRYGDILIIRYNVNLTSDLAGDPDFYWEREKLEKLYIFTKGQLNIGRRVKEINNRIDYCYELISVLREQLGDRHHVKLEWYIILLIAAELFIEVLSKVIKIF